MTERTQEPRPPDSEGSKLSPEQQEALDRGLRLIGKMIAREYLSTGEDRPENTGRKNS